MFISTIFLDSVGMCYKESEVAQSCPTLGDPMDCSLPGSSVHGIFQAIVLEWIAISFSSGPHFIRTLHHGLSIFVALQGMAHSFIEVDKAVVHMIRLVSFL